MLDFLNGLSLTTDTIFWACLFVGTALGIISVVVGDIIDFAFDTGDFGPFSGPVIASFLVLFGGGGLIAESLLGTGPAASVVVATLTGLVGSTVVYFAFAKLILTQEGGTVYDPKNWVGHEAEVIIEVPEEGLGEITFDAPSGRISAGARSIDGTRIPRNSIVLIEKHIGGNFVVRNTAVPAGNAENNPGGNNVGEKTATTDAKPQGVSPQ
ncbi:MAG: hypothetical protein PWP23_900 [Candidatus Sumerlaeota bacterium]|nr:hypothetical protein [Candidatus Sumerlaeota bacterium]